MILASLARVWKSLQVLIQKKLLITKISKIKKKRIGLFKISMWIVRIRWIRIIIYQIEIFDNINKSEKLNYKL